MAFIREYAEAQGDPFSLRRPKFLRKLQPGRFVKKAALGLVRNTIPGAGAAMDFARSFGWDMGDPPKPGKRRKNAGSGPKQKAAAKATKRAQRAQRGAAPKGKKGKKLNIDWNKLGQAAAAGIPIVGGVGSEILNQLHPFGGADGGSGASPDFGTFDASGVTPIAGGMHPAHAKALARAMGGHKRHTMNPANVHALRRSIRRLDGFEKLVKRVMPHLLTAHGHKRTSGHRHGCGCVACKHKR